MGLLDLINDGTKNSKNDVGKIVKTPRIREDSPNRAFDTPHRSNKKSNQGNRRNVNSKQKERVTIIGKEHRITIQKVANVVMRHANGNLKKRYNELMEMIME